MENTDKRLVIDVEAILASKGAKKVPRFLVNFLKRIIHQDELNRFLAISEGYTGAEFASKALEFFDVKYIIHNEENLPRDDKKYIVASNHPLGGLDGLILISLIGKMMGDVRFIVNDLLMFVTPLEPIFVPVNKFGRLNQDYADKIKKAFESNAQILYFPAGLCSRLEKGVIKDLDWKKTFVTKAIETQRDILPIYFSGRNSMFFYRLSKWRKKLGIKFNIEMLFLVDEMVKQRGKTFDIYIRESIPYTSLTKEKSALGWTKHIRSICYGENSN